MKNQKRIFAQFSKVEKQEDGTLKVYGVASSETRDSDGEVILADAMRKALPDYLTFGAVREMHQPIAAGTAIEASVDDAGVTQFAAHVVDPVSVKKVETGVLKGFSIGGKIVKRDKDDKTIITELKLSEVSLVDRPANPDAVITLVKFDGSGKVVPSSPSEDPAMKKSAALKKGLYQISDLASCIMSLRWLWESVAAEEAWEGDGSTLSAKIRSCIGELCACLKDMVDEETGEMLGLMGESDVIAMAEKISKAYQSGALKKANTTATAEQVAELSTKVAAALEALGKQPPVAKGDTTMDDKEKETLAKAQGDLAKALEAQKTAEDALAKATKEKDDAVTAQKKAEGERDEIAKEAKTLADQVMAKGGLRSVPRSSDSGLETSETVSTKSEKKEPETAASAVKAAWGNPLSGVTNRPLEKKS